VSDHRLQRYDADADAGAAGQYTDYPFAGWVQTLTDPDLAEMIDDNAFLTEMFVSVYDPSRISSDFIFNRAPLDTEYRDVVYESTDVSGFVVLAVIAVAVIAVLAGVFALWRRRATSSTLR
jgi:hypothetical protein